jgi:hypothetical protein
MKKSYDSPSVQEETRTVPVMVQLEKSLQRRIEEQAKKRGLSVEDYILEALTMEIFYPGGIIGFRMSALVDKIREVRDRLTTNWGITIT